MLNVNAQQRPPSFIPPFVVSRFSPTEVRLLRRPDSTAGNKLHGPIRRRSSPKCDQSTIANRVFLRPRARTGVLSWLTQCPWVPSRLPAKGVARGVTWAWRISYNRRIAFWRIGQGTGHLRQNKPKSCGADLQEKYREIGAILLEVDGFRIDCPFDLLAR